MHALSSPPLHGKRPRGLWKERRDAAAHAMSKLGFLSHDFDTDSVLSASASSHGGDVFDDDLDDGHSSDSSCKRRRLSGALSDSDTLWLRSPASRSLTPDFCYNAPYFPSQALKSPPYSPPITNIRMQSSSDRLSSINDQPKGKQSSTSDLEDWENLKELFARASESYECTCIHLISVWDISAPAVFRFAFRAHDARVCVAIIASTGTMHLRLPSGLMSRWSDQTGLLQNTASGGAVVCSQRTEPHRMSGREVEVQHPCVASRPLRCISPQASWSKWAITARFSSAPLSSRRVRQAGSRRSRILRHGHGHASPTQACFCRPGRAFR